KRVGNSVCVPLIEALAIEIDQQILSKKGEKALPTHYDVLEELYDQAQNITLEEIEITPEEKDLLQIIVDESEKRKGVYSVLITSLTHKIISPEQDVRLHQYNLENGYSG